MKNLIITFALLTFFALGKLSAQTVYVTESGKKYHAKNCELAKTGKKGMPLAEAKKAGYEPCKNCKADSAKSKEQVKDKPKEKKGK